MRTNFFMGQPNVIFKNAQIVNDNLIKQRGVENTAKQSQQSRKDRVFLSVQGKSSSNMIENLQKQKQALMDKKSEVRAKALQDGKSAQQIDALIETYDMQIKNIDMQIARIQTEQTEKIAEQTEQNPKHTEPKTEEELQKQQLSSLTKLATHAQQADTMYAVKKEIDGQANVLKSEIELDKAHGVGKETIERKQGELAKMELRSDNIMNTIGEKIEKTNQIAQKNIQLSEQQKKDDDDIEPLQNQKKEENK